jgi:TPR repeat protein
METIGMDFYNGYGVEKDIERAVVWFQRAAAHGQKEALEMLERIRKENE